MPANPKYLNKNPWQRFAKLTVGTIGGYAITALLHMNLAILFPLHSEVLITTLITVFPVWCILAIIPFVLKNGWLTWLYYLIIIAILYGIYYLIQPHNPFV